MSIFPKRTIPGKTVTIHWNFNTAHLKEQHIYPFIKIGVKVPNGEIKMLFEDYILALPDEKNNSKHTFEKLKYLNKNIPLLVLADYLKGQSKREKLVEILSNIQAGRHYYFTYQIPKDAPLGKYTLISEVHNKGHVKYSKTRIDDFFFVEKISLVDVVKKGKEKVAIIQNHSEEKTPVKIVECSVKENGGMTTELKVFEMIPREIKAVKISHMKTFLQYNEERETISLSKPVAKYLIKNHELLNINKKDGEHCLMNKDTEEAFWLSPEAEKLWNKSDGLLNKNSLSDHELDVLKEMEGQGIIKEIKLQ